ncbi:MAG: protein kinase [Lachnospiraceae bacterium]|nr:protein kinase [Lachnospiraceae bacterium]
MNESFNTICPNCFADRIEDNVCPACGYDRKAEQTNSMALPPFTMLHSRYLTGRIIGSGGFGITYIAYDIMSNKIRAVKEYVPLGIASRMADHVTLAETAADKYDSFVHGKKRFYEEAKVLYACSEIPDVVEILDYFQENNTVYFVMEYIRGVTLKRFIVSNGGKLPLDISMQIICDAGNALEQVHQKVAIFHRDISPENIMITTEEKIKIIDFGNAKTIDRGKLSVVLKPGFAPPEQYSSQAKQGRYTDVYALAGTFYYMVSGVTLPVAPDRLTGSDYIKLKDMNLGIDASMSNAVDKALALNNKDRYQTVGEFINALFPITVTNYNEPKKEYRNDLSAKHKSSVEKGSPYLEIIEGVMVGAGWNIKSNTQVGIGRAEAQADIVIEGSLEISRLHFLLEYNTQTGSFYIEDVSQNGVFVEGYALEKYKKYELPVDSKAVLGVDVCTVKLGVEYGKT